jgi:hypothetical protein
VGPAALKCGLGLRSHLRPRSWARILRIPDLNTYNGRDDWNNIAPSVG